MEASDDEACCLEAWVVAFFSTEREREERSLRELDPERDRERRRKRCLASLGSSSITTLVITRA